MPYLLLVLTTLFWSGNFVISRGMHSEIPPLALSFWRWVVALFILLFFAFKFLVQQRKLALGCSRFLIVQGILGVAGFNSLIYLAMQTTTAINAVLVNSCIPVIIVLISRTLHNEKLRLQQTIGVVTSFMGVVLIVSQGSPAVFTSLHFNIGDLFVFLAAIFWAFYSVNLRNYPTGLHPLAYLCAIVIIGIIVLAPLYLLELAGGASMELNVSNLLTIFYVALFASVLAFIFWNRAVTELGANTAGPFIHLMPVFSTIMAVLFLDEKFTSLHIMAILFIFTGIFLVTYSHKKTHTPARRAGRQKPAD